MAATASAPASAAARARARALRPPPAAPAALVLALLALLAVLAQAAAAGRAAPAADARSRESDKEVGEAMADLRRKVVMKLYTRQSAEEGELLSVDDPAPLDRSFFDPLVPTKIIVHGWLSGEANNTGGSLLKDSLLDSSAYNVILVDWSAADSYNYVSSRAQVAALGRLVAELVGQLVAAGLELDDLHLIGHSLGAHVMGFAGRAAALGDKGRITGLDPAGPLFWNSASVRLDAADAGFVDVIHTCAPLAGYWEPIGHADFYPNGGTWVQPGCGIDAGACSHCRSYSLLLESIESPGAFVATKCTGWRHFVDGKCADSARAEMGLGCDRESRGSFYLETRKEPPYSATSRRPASDRLKRSKNFTKC